MVADRHRLAAYHNKHCRRAFQWCQHQWPWTTLNPQNRGFRWFFCYFWLWRTLTVNFRWNILENGDRPRQPVYEIKLMLWRISWALAQISCTQQCSSKEICAVLLSEMCGWQVDNFSKKTVIPASSNLLCSKQIINQFGVLVSFILGLAHPVGASWLLVCKCKVLYYMHKTVKNSIKICHSKWKCVLAFVP